MIAMKPMKLLTLAGLVLLVVSCNKGSESCGNQDIDERVNTHPKTEAFTGVELQTCANVFLSDAEACDVRLEGDSKAIDNLNIYVKDGILHIDKKKNGCFSWHHDVDVYVSAPLFKYLGISGSGDMEALTDFQGTELTMNISGSGNIVQKNLLNDATYVIIKGSGDIGTQTLTTSKLETTIKGSGNISVDSGTSPYHTSLISGSGNILAMGMDTDVTDATLSGSGNFEVTASSELHVVLSGSGNVTYSGNPVLTSSVTGSGDVSHQ